MSERTTITCICRIDVEDNEYEALTIVDNMLKRPQAVTDIKTGLRSEKLTLIVNETITTTSHGCGVRYKKKEHG